MSATDLETVLEGLPRISDSNLLFGTGIGDDAGVYQLRDDLAIVQTVDFFTPIVDDPYDFGAIAAANALSDCYTLGAVPVTALNVVSFPCKVGLDVLREILKGGADAVAEAGACIVGGHSVQDTEPKYGLAVTGVIKPSELIRNDGAKLGDVLVVNKALGTGIATNVWKKEGQTQLSAASFSAVVDSMKQLHKAALPLMRQFAVSATTDITGFGFLGHAQSVAAASGVSFRIEASKVPAFPEVRAIAAEFGGGGAKRNEAYCGAMIDRDSAVSDNDYVLLHDAQTSGPILFSVAATDAEQFVTELRSAGFASTEIVGEVIDGPPGRVRVER